MNEFDIKAADWDKNQMHWERSEAIAKYIMKLIPLKKEMTAMEYGAGTGITSFLLKDHLKEITLMDNSAEMVKVMTEKIKVNKAENLKVINFDLEHLDYDGGKFDLIFTQMVLHHVADTDSITGKFKDLLKPGGYLAVADLYEEDGSFHGEEFTGHRGFNIEHFTDTLKKHKFENISHRTCYIIERKISDSETKHFDVFLLIAKNK